MKTLTKIITIATVIASTALTANATTFSTADDSFWSKVCHATAINDTRALNRLINRSNYDSKYVGKATTCNGTKILDFAIKHKAMDTYRHLKRSQRSM